MLKLIQLQAGASTKIGDGSSASDENSSERMPISVFSHGSGVPWGAGNLRPDGQQSICPNYMDVTYKSFANFPDENASWYTRRYKEYGYQEWAS